MLTKPERTEPVEAAASTGLRAERTADAAFQDEMLQGVSRTFALTIPELPEGLREAVGNGYLLCRILDTIEDEPALNAFEKRALLERFSRVVGGKEPAAPFGAALAPELSTHTIAAEHVLIQQVDRVIAITHGLAPAQQTALQRCVRVMASGMAGFQEAAERGQEGVATLEAMNRYCYFVAGVVGEMLTDLFCAFDPEAQGNAETLRKLAPSFGQGLQMTNILKDVWEDRERSACWLPRDVFGLGPDASFDTLRSEHPERLHAGLRVLLGHAHGHLRNALQYTLAIPASQPGIRRFCLRALGMALLTLRRIHAHPDFTSGGQVKISRRTVKVCIGFTNVAARHNWLLSAAFWLFGRGVPLTQPGALDTRPFDPAELSAGQ
ncbi:MAG: phytoene/squalene synthase family protein [Opitutales bacterium]